MASLRPLLVLATFLCLVGVDGVKIVSLAVPAVVAEGSGAVNLDCVYQVADHERQGLVVQWFLRDLLVYQWIPGKQPQDNGPLKGRLDLTYRATDDPNQRHRALRILRPTPDLAGAYRCKVASFEDEDTATDSMTVYVGAESMSIDYEETERGDQLNVSCRVRGVYPQPVVQLATEDAHQTHRTPMAEATLDLAARDDGRFDALVWQLVDRRRLAFDEETVFECLLTLPDTEYTNSQRIAYFPGFAASSSSATPPLAADVAADVAATAAATAAAAAAGDVVYDNGLVDGDVDDDDDDGWLPDASTSASPSVSAPHLSDVSDQSDEAHNGLWQSTGRGIRAHDRLTESGAAVSSPSLGASLLIVIAVAALY